MHVRHSGRDLGLFEHIHFTKQRDREREKRAMTAVYDGRPIIAPIGIDSRGERASGGLPPVGKSFDQRSKPLGPLASIGLLIFLRVRSY